MGDMREAVLAIYKSRKNLALTLQDSKTVIAKLELIFGTMLHVLAFFVYLIIFQVWACPVRHADHFMWFESHMLIASE